MEIIFSQGEFQRSGKGMFTYTYILPGYNILTYDKILILTII